MALKEVDSKIYQQVRKFLNAFMHLDLGKCYLQVLNIPNDDLKLQTNFKLMLCGFSGQGKTEWIISLLKNASKMMVDSFQEVIYCIPINCGHLPSVKHTIDKMKEIHENLTVYEGLLIEVESIFKPNKDSDHCLIIYDDLYTEIINSRPFSHFVIHGSRHHNTSLIVTTQNYFESSKYALTVRRQFTYLALFFPPADRQMLLTLGRILFPGNSNCLMNCFKKLLPHTTTPFDHYILIDINPKSPLPYGMRLRANVFSQTPYFFITED